VLRPLAENGAEKRGLGWVTTRQWAVLSTVVRSVDDYFRQQSPRSTKPGIIRAVSHRHCRLETVYRASGKCL